MTDVNQPELIHEERTENNPADQAKREEYRRRLAEYLKDPAFHFIEGFPIGEDEDILALSDPPYYTACPNPFLPEIITEWQQERATLHQKLDLSDENYQHEPFAADVSEGKNDPLYNAHSYHTKVPHKAIMRYILHYTDPGDIVFDGFCGTGMTGVAAQLCGDRKAVEELGYRVDDKALVWEGNKAISRLGARKVVLNDLSPAATFIAYNYNTPVDAVAFEREAKQILREVEQEYGWMYETWHPNCDAPNRVKGKINYTVWSDVFVCPQCGAEMAFWDVAVDQRKDDDIRGVWNCPKCGSLLSKIHSKRTHALRVERAHETSYDRFIGKMVRCTKRVPSQINYSIGKNRYEKRPDSEDILLVDRIEKFDGNNQFWSYPMMFIGEKWGDTWRAGIHEGISHTHHFYTKRNLLLLGAIWHRIDNITDKQVKASILFLFQSLLLGFTRLNRYGATHYSQVNRFLSGTLYVSSLMSEVSLQYAFDGKLSRLIKAFSQVKTNNFASAINTSSSTNINLKSNGLDYIFVDPPFGGNLMYSELNFLWESWQKVFTNIKTEAIVNQHQHKGQVEYQGLMQACFNEFHRVLKPGRWITVEFHNSQNSIWNAIQETLQRAGFVIADVRVLDKQQETFKQATTTAAVKQDLIISAYKPNGRLEEGFMLKAGTEEGAWEFIRYHLGKMPVVNQANGTAAVNAERQAFLLFDRMVAFHVQRGVMVPLSAPEFYAGLEQRFIRRDSMYFLPNQVSEYDRTLLDSGKPTQIPLFVTDEKTAITWLRQQLDLASGGEPQTRGELTNKFNQTMHRAKHEKALELVDILEQNFLQDEAGKWYVPDHNRASDLEKLRQRSLLREFHEYTNFSGRLRQFRTEAVRAGFADCFKRQDYGTIVKVAKRLPEDVLREDPDLLMYYDSAMLRKK